MVPAQKVVAEDRLAAQWRELSRAHWHADPVAAVLDVHVDAAWAQLGNSSMED